MKINRGVKGVSIIIERVEFLPQTLNSYIYGSQIYFKLIILFGKISLKYTQFGYTYIWGLENLSFQQCVILKKKKVQ